MEVGLWNVGNKSHIVRAVKSISAKDFCWTDLFEKCELFWKHASTGEIITGCLEHDQVPDKFWCPTKITNGGHDPKENVNVGFCNDDCPAHSEERLEFLKSWEITEVPIR